VPPVAKFLRWLDGQEDLFLENQTAQLDNINIITLVARNDDKHNNLWVSCFHGNSTSLGMVSHKVFFLFFTNYVYNGLCNEPKWLAGIDYLQRKKSENLHFAKTGIFGEYPAPVSCLL